MPSDELAQALLPFVPPNRTCTLAAKFWPLMVALVLVAPAFGEIPKINGTGTT